MTDSPSFGWETVDGVLAEPNIVELIGFYWEELSPLKEQVPLAPDFAKMRSLEACGIFRVWGARSGNGQLAGFILWYLMPHLNYRHTLFAFDAGHYLDPEARNRDWTGVKMWRSVLPELKHLGVKVVIAHDNHKRPLRPLFKRLGFEPRSTNYWRVL